MENIVECLFTEQNNTLVIKVLEWNNKTIDICFAGTVAFIKTVGDCLSYLKEEQKDNMLLNSTIKKIYDEIPETNPYKAFSLYDIYDMPIVTVIATEYIICPKEKEIN